MRLINSFSAFATLALASASHATVVADFAADYQPNTPSAGWSYLWNQNGPLIDSFFTAQTANFSPLVYDGVGDNSGYQTVANEAYPDPAPGGYTRVTATNVYPGQTAAQNAVQRFVILAYTFSAEEVAAHGNALLFHTYDFQVPSSLSAPIDVFVFKNTAPVFFSPTGFGPPGFSDAIFGQDYSFGTVAANDTLYIALGAREAYAGDPLGVAFTLALVPEPTSLAVMGALPMLLRRKR